MLCHFVCNTCDTSGACKILLPESLWDCSKTPHPYGEVLCTFGNVLTRCKLLIMSLTPSTHQKDLPTNKIYTCLFPNSYTLLQATVVAQFDVAKQPLNDIKPMSTAFIKLQVLPIDLANLITIIKLPTLTSGFSHHM